MSRALLLLLCLFMAGCAAQDGRKVVGTQWVDGKPVRVYADSEADKAALKREADELRKLNDATTFEPRKK